MAVEDWINFDWDPHEDCDTEEVRYQNIVHETPKAILFENKHGRFWLPKSQIEVDKETRMVFYPDWIKITYLPKWRV